MDPITMALIMAGGKGISSIGKYLTRPKTTPYRTSAMGKYLRRISEQGIYSPAMQSRILGRTTSAAANVAQSRRSKTRGYLESMGMGTSIAGARALDQPLSELQRTASEKASELELANEMSKINALRQYYMGAEQHKAMKEGRATQAKSELFSGLGGAVESGMGSYLTGKQLGMAEKQLMPQINLLAARAKYYGADRGAKTEIPATNKFLKMSETDVMRWAYENGMDPDDLLRLYYDEKAKSTGYQLEGM